MEAAPAVTPRGGVAAGERPAGSGDNSTALLAGSTAGAALLAGAGTFVLRRRSAAGLRLTRTPTVAPPRTGAAPHAVPSRKFTSHPDSGVSCAVARTPTASGGPPPC